MVGPAAPKVGSSSSSCSRVAHVARPSKVAARSLRLNAVAQNASPSPEDFDRRAFLRALSMGAISVASTLAIGEDANALNTYTQPKPFKTDFEKYDGRPGGTVGPMQMAHMRLVPSIEILLRSHNSAFLLWRIWGKIYHQLDKIRVCCGRCGPLASPVTPEGHRMRS